MGRMMVCVVDVGYMSAIFPPTLMGAEVLPHFLPVVSSQRQGAPAGSAPPGSARLG